MYVQLARAELHLDGQVTGGIGIIKAIIFAVVGIALIILGSISRLKIESTATH